jgi:AcrR family transcriptional regulator
MVAVRSGSAASPYPHTKVNRDDWLRAAQELAVREGMAAVKVLTLAATLEVSRSSFYWYFKSRGDLLDQMLSQWREKNTPAILARAARPSPSINRNILAIAECWFDPELFDPRLDFAIREWARRSGPVRAEVDAADKARVDAISAMFRRHGFAETEAFIRARVLYFTQIGYYALEVTEPEEARVAYAAVYLRGFSGVEPEPEDLVEFQVFMARFRDRR